MPNGYLIVSELDDILQSGYYKSLLGYDNVDWFFNEVIKLEIKMNFYFMNTKKNLIVTEEKKRRF